MFLINFIKRCRRHNHYGEVLLEEMKPLLPLSKSNNSQSSNRNGRGSSSNNSLPTSSKVTTLQIQQKIQQTLAHKKRLSDIYL